MLQVERVSFSYDRPVLKELSVTIQDGEFSILVGENGSGKSTLLKILVGLVRSQSGTVSLDGLDPSLPQDLPEIRKKIGYLFQNPEDQIVSPLVEEEVAFGLGSLGLSEEETNARVEEALSLTGLLHHRQSLTHELSGGEKQRLALAGLLAVQPSLLLLDEPTSLLDIQSREALHPILRACGTTILMVTHELDEIAWGDRLLMLEEGKIRDLGNPADLLADPEALSRSGLEIPFSMKLDSLLDRFEEARRRS